MTEDEQQDSGNSADSTADAIDTADVADVADTAGTTDAIDALPETSGDFDSHRADETQKVAETQAFEESKVPEGPQREAAESMADLEADANQAPGMTEPVAQPEADANQSAVPAHFEPIPAEKLARAKRSRRALIAIIILLILVLAGAVAGSIYYYLNHAQTPGQIEQPSLAIEEDIDAVQDRGTTESIEMPNLVRMFGKTPEEAVAALGSEYTITNRVENLAEEEPSSSQTDETDASETPEAASETETLAAQVVTVSYTPERQTSSVGTTQVQNIYLSLDKTGTVIEVYFVSSMNLLDFPISSFVDLVGSKNTFVDTLSSAGVTAASSVSYTAPTVEEFTEYVDAEASNKKVKKESAVWQGALASEQPPTRFEITFTYDFGASGVEDRPDRQPTQRMLYIKLG